MIRNYYRKIDKPLDQMVGGHLATLVAAILTGWGQLPPAVVILLGLILAGMVIWFSNAIGSLLWAAQIVAANVTQYLARISRAAACAITKAMTAAERAVKNRTSAIALRALVRRFEAVGIIDPNISPIVLPSPSDPLL
jgi:hypothetical protein